MNGSMPMSIRRTTRRQRVVGVQGREHRWPVSAARRQVCAVSWSRTSPTRMTSGSWRRKERSADGEGQADRWRAPGPD